MKRTILLAAFLLVDGGSAAHASGLDGTYKGVSMVTARSGDPGSFASCGTVDDVSLVVKGSAISMGSLAGKVEANGTFSLQGKLKPDAGVTTINGTIVGKELNAKWATPGAKVSCAGEISAER